MTEVPLLAAGQGVINVEHFHFQNLLLKSISI